MFGSFTAPIFHMSLTNRTKNIVSCKRRCVWLQKSLTYETLISGLLINIVNWCIWCFLGKSKFTCTIQMKDLLNWPTAGQMEVKNISKFISIVARSRKMSVLQTFLLDQVLRVEKSCKKRSLYKWRHVLRKGRK